jgi:hypothetical protein
VKSVIGDDREKRGVFARKTTTPTCMTADSAGKTFHGNWGLLEEIALTHPSGSQAKAMSKRAAPLKTAMSKLFPRIAALLWALLPQVDCSPAVQSLVMCLYCIASGMATNQLKMLYAQMFNILLARGPLNHRLPIAAGRD